MNASMCRFSASSELSNAWRATTQSATDEPMKTVASEAPMNANTMATTYRTANPRQRRYFTSQNQISPALA